MSRLSTQCSLATFSRRTLDWSTELNHFKPSLPSLGLFLCHLTQSLRTEIEDKNIVTFLLSIITGKKTAYLNWPSQVKMQLNWISNTDWLSGVQWYFLPKTNQKEWINLDTKQWHIAFRTWKCHITEVINHKYLYLISVISCHKVVFVFALRRLLELYSH